MIIFLHSPNQGQFMRHQTRSLLGQDTSDIGPVLFCMFMDRDKVEVHKHAKKERGKYPAIKIRTRAVFKKTSTNYILLIISFIIIRSCSKHC